MIFSLSYNYFVHGQKDLPQPCDTPNSEIYCKGGEGSLLHTVQLAKIYENDTTRPDKSSKTFVDQPIKFTVQEVLDNFKQFMVNCLTWQNCHQFSYIFHTIIIS